jgi:hypothetical protein
MQKLNAKWLDIDVKKPKKILGACGFVRYLVTSSIAFLGLFQALQIGYSRSITYQRLLAALDHEQRDLRLPTSRPTLTKVRANYPSARDGCISKVWGSLYK